MRRVKSSLNSFFKAILDGLYPSKCTICGLDSDHNPCPVCVSFMVPLAQEFRFGDKASISFIACVFEYEGAAGTAVRRLKYSRSTTLADFMAGKLAELVHEKSQEKDLIIPVPIHWTRRNERGFNQAELLCSKIEGREIAHWALQRKRVTRPQAALDLQGRMTNLKGAFRAHQNVAGRRCILVDDVLTSGSTALECARCLKEAGASEVGVITFAGNPSESIQ